MSLVAWREREPNAASCRRSRPSLTNGASTIMPGDGTGVPFDGRYPLPRPRLRYGDPMTFREFIYAPLEGRTSPSRVFWLYGMVGSLVYSALGLLLPPGARVGRLYTLGGLLLSLYVIVATYRCAVLCRTPTRAYWVRVSCIVSFMLLPVFAYLEFSGALSSDLSQLDALGL